MPTTIDKIRTQILEPWEEACGEVQNIEIENESVFLKFTGGTIINLTMPSEEIVKRLTDAVGKKVNILRTDIIGKEYCLKISEENRGKNHTFCR
jgi:hypothetical protein